MSLSCSLGTGVRLHVTFSSLILHHCFTEWKFCQVLFILLLLFRGFLSGKLKGSKKEEIFTFGNQIVYVLPLLFIVRFGFFLNSSLITFVICRKNIYCFFNRLSFPDYSPPNGSLQMLRIKECTVKKTNGIVL